MPTSLIVEQEVSNFYNNCALPDTSMTISACVLQTFWIMNLILGNAIFSIYIMATLIFKMAVKLIIRTFDSFLFNLRKCWQPVARIMHNWQL